MSILLIWSRFRHTPLIRFMGISCMHGLQFHLWCCIMHCNYSTWQAVITLQSPKLYKNYNHTIWYKLHSFQASKISAERVIRDQGSNLQNKSVFYDVTGQLNPIIQFSQAGFETWSESSKCSADTRWKISILPGGNKLEEIQKWDLRC